MNRKRILTIILLFLIASLDICLIRSLEQTHGWLRGKSQLLNEEEALRTLRAFALPKDSPSDIRNESSENILAYLFCQSSGQSGLEEWCRREKAAAPKTYESYTSAVEKLLADAVYFPVPKALHNKDAVVTYENSWQYERTYGGARGHEGCDIMAGIQRRGYYPVVSVSDGVVEKKGWLPQGGYRIGIRSGHGVYYYYAHLAEYEENIKEGTRITAGQLIGYMGDTGYSEKEGTTGNFPVHLHFGMYLDNEDGEEVSFNPYYLLLLLEAHKLTYVYDH